MSDLPKGWTETVLTDVASNEKFSIVDGPFGSDLKLTDYVQDGTVPVLTTKNLTGTYDPNSVRFISSKKFDQLKRSKVESGDILLAKIGSIGKCSIYPENAPTAIIPANLCKITVNSELIWNRFLFWQFNTSEFQEKLKEITSATAQPAFSVKRFKTLTVKLPPLNEQRRIVKKLEKLLGKVEAVQGRLDKIPAILKRFRQAVLAAACSGNLTKDWRNEKKLSDEWKTTELSKLFSMRNGKSMTAKMMKQGEIPVFGGNGQAGTHNAHNVEGLIIIIGRVGAQCGNVHFVNGKVWVSDNAISLQAKQEIDQQFYAHFLTSLNLNQLSGGTGQPYVSQEILSPIESPIVSIEEQKEIVRRVEDLFKFADQIEARYKKARSYTDKLTQSILAKAFRGELVPQDERDEPASVLLERIGEEKLIQAKPVKVKQKATIQKEGEQQSLFAKG